MEYFILIAALIAIVLGANNLVDGAVSVARKYKVSDFIIGAIIVGVGTSLPELVVSIKGAIDSNVDIAIGNVVGSNIFNIFGILGVTALIFPVAVSKGNLRFDLPVCIGTSILATLLAFNLFNGTEPIIGRGDGLILLTIFVLFIYISFIENRKNGAVQDSYTQSQHSSNIIVATIKIVLGLIVLIAGAHFFVESAIVVAKAWGVNEAFISITLIACGTSLPEFAVSIAAAAKRNTQLALGNIIGSNIFNITFILGLGSQIRPLQGGGITIADYLVMIAATLFPLILGARGKISRLSGAVMLSAFIIYNIYLLNTHTL